MLVEVLHEAKSFLPEDVYENLKSGLDFAFCSGPEGSYLH